MSNSSHEGKLFVGIDGGGTKCKARLENEHGELLAEATTGPANAARDMQGSIKNIVDACTQCLLTAGLNADRLSDLNVGMGLAGINLPSVKQAFQEHTFPFASAKVTTDLHIACLGAHHGKEGTIVIVGTGSSGIAVSAEGHTILGGHGFQVGDKGSGAWIGKTAIAHCLETLDGIVEPNELANAVMSHMDCRQTSELVALTVSAPPALFATLAPLVFDLAANKQVDAMRIIDDAASYITALTENLLIHSPSRLAFIGGVSHALSAYLPANLRQKITRPLSSPEAGAILFIKSTLPTEMYK